MPVTVYFATNRVISAQLGGPTNVGAYTDAIVSPTDPGQITFATAFVDDANLTADTVGAINSIQDISKGGFAANAIGDLSSPGRNLLVFIHGFDNSFENAITRAAFNQQWIADPKKRAGETTVVTFSWPSLGKLISAPLPWDDYFHDQTVAGQSGAHVMSFFAQLEPIISDARRSGSRCFLLAHSMGNWVLQAAVESWFSHGRGAANLFDGAFLAAADERYDTFSIPFPGRLSGLKQLAKRICVLYSRADDVLGVSEMLNLGAQRLGQDGPKDMGDATQFPAAQYAMIDCSSFADYDRDFASSHQYYRRSPAAREAIIAQM